MSDTSPKSVMEPPSLGEVAGKVGDRREAILDGRIIPSPVRRSLFSVDDEQVNAYRVEIQTDSVFKRPIPARFSESEKEEYLAEFDLVDTEGEFIPPESPLRMAFPTASPSETEEKTGRDLITLNLNGSLEVSLKDAEKGDAKPLLTVRDLVTRKNSKERSLKGFLKGAKKGDGKPAPPEMAPVRDLVTRTNPKEGSLQGSLKGAKKGDGKPPPPPEIRDFVTRTNSKEGSLQGSLKGAKKGDGKPPPPPEMAPVRDLLTRSNSKEGSLKGAKKGDGKPPPPSEMAPVRDIVTRTNSKEGSLKGANKEDDKPPLPEEVHLRDSVSRTYSKEGSLQTSLKGAKNEDGKPPLPQEVHLRDSASRANSKEGSLQASLKGAKKEDGKSPLPEEVHIRDSVSRTISKECSLQGSLKGAKKGDGKPPLSEVAPERDIISRTSSKEGSIQRSIDVESVTLPELATEGDEDSMPSEEGMEVYAMEAVYAKTLPPPSERNEKPSPLFFGLSPFRKRTPSSESSLNETATVEAKPLPAQPKTFAPPRVKSKHATPHAKAKSMENKQGEVKSKPPLPEEIKSTPPPVVPQEKAKSMENKQKEVKSTPPLSKIVGEAVKSTPPLTTPQDMAKSMEKKQVDVKSTPPLPKKEEVKPTPPQEEMRPAEEMKPPPPQQEKPLGDQSSPSSESNEVYAKPSTQWCEIEATQKDTISPLASNTKLVPTMSTPPPGDDTESMTTSSSAESEATEDIKPPKRFPGEAAVEGILERFFDKVTCTCIKDTRNCVDKCAPTDDNELPGYMVVEIQKIHQKAQEKKAEMAARKQARRMKKKGNNKDASSKKEKKSKAIGLPKRDKGEKEMKRPSLERKVPEWGEKVLDEESVSTTASRKAGGFTVGQFIQKKFAMFEHSLTRGKDDESEGMGTQSYFMDSHGAILNIKSVTDTATAGSSAAARIAKSFRSRKGMQGTEERVIFLSPDDEDGTESLLDGDDDGDLLLEDEESEYTTELIQVDFDPSKLGNSKEADMYLAREVLRRYAEITGISLDELIEDVVDESLASLTLDTYGFPVERD